MAQSANYDATKEDSRPWRTQHDTDAAAKDAAAVAESVNVAADTTKYATYNGLKVAPVSVTVAGTAQPVVTPISYTTGSYSYSSSNPAKFTVNATTGLVTGVQAGTATLTVRNGALSGTATVTVS